MNRPASFRAVKFFPLFALALLAGCETPYTKFTVTDYQGNRTATWVAEGHYTLTDQGYRISAVERTTAPPNVITNHYPNGWNTMVVGVNIVHEHIDKPEWLKRLDGESSTTVVERTAVVDPAK
jgi:hypothetical protein